MSHKRKRTIFALSRQDGLKGTSASRQLKPRMKYYRKSPFCIMLKIKNLIVSAWVVGCSMLFWQCDKIEEPFKEVTAQEVTVDTPYFAPQAAFLQKYLLEDDTGHTCINCPAAHKVLHEMQGQLGDTLVCMAVHSGSNAKPEEGLFSTDFRTNLGDYLATHFSVSGYPKGMINRLTFDGKRVLDRGDWKARMASIPRLPATLGLQIRDTTLPSRPDTAYIFVKTTFLQQTARKLQLCVVLTEDSLIAPQKNGLQIDTHYVHNHVLRHSLSPITGTLLNNGGSREAGAAEIRAYPLFRNPAWQWRRCHIVATVIDTETEEILQAESHPLK